MQNKINFLLSPFGSIFQAAVGARQRLYQKKVFKTFDLGVPVVSVGNLTVGGTGKTPLVAFVARALAEQNLRVCVLTRGYKRRNQKERVLVSDGQKILATPAEAGDEAFELAGKLIGISSVIADRNRAAAGFWARGNLKSNAFVLDDGMQHLRVRRDLEIVTIDATNPFGNGKLLPAGVLREPVTGLRRADCVVVTRADLAQNLSELKSQIEKINARCPILFARTKIVRLAEIKEFHAGEAQSGQRPQSDKFSKTEDLRPKTVLAFCGLGNPHAFFEQLRNQNFKLLGTESFPDHYAYAQADIEKIERKAREVNAAVLLTTAKDAVKMNNLKFALPCFVVEIEMVFDCDKPLLELLAKL